jgi:GNAT superfamily N-acetyltransferase
MPTVRDLTPEDAPALTALYEQYDWWADRDPARVRVALEATEVAVGVEDGSEGLVAAARVLTDYAYYANVFDVVVAADRRGEGVGRLLLEGVLTHPDLEAVDGLGLLCREGLVPFYESVGFERFGPEVTVPEGDREELVRMTYSNDDTDSDSDNGNRDGQRG